MKKTERLMLRSFLVKNHCRCRSCTLERKSVVRRAKRLARKETRLLPREVE